VTDVANDNTLPEHYERLRLDVISEAHQGPSTPIAAAILEDNTAPAGQQIGGEQ